MKIKRKNIKPTTYIKRCFCMGVENCNDKGCVLVKRGVKRKTK